MLTRTPRRVASERAIDTAVENSLALAVALLFWIIDLKEGTAAANKIARSATAINNSTRVNPK